MLLADKLYFKIYASGTPFRKGVKYSAATRKFVAAFLLFILGIFLFPYYYI